jgi:thiamine-monophosphate kinase
LTVLIIAPAGGFGGCYCVKPMTEFELIQQYFTRNGGDAVLGVGDDAAIVRPTPGCDLHVSVDMLVEGRHFFADVDPEALGHKTLAVNLSDMAAMGARPRWALLSLALPRADADWLAGFSRGLLTLARRHGVALIGGDTTCGPLTLSLTIMGETPSGTGLCRHAAQEGDDIWVSGALGLAALALRQRLHGDVAPPADVLALCQRRLDWPEARLELGRALLDVAHACIDVSDGLMADLGHILERSALGAELWLEALPTHRWLGERRAMLAETLAAGGDDYELCFTAAAARREQIAALSALCPVTRIGRVLRAGGARLIAADGNLVALGRHGFDHLEN